MTFNSMLTFILLVAAVVIFLQLRSVLGRRTGNERPRLDPYTSQKTEAPEGVESNDNVVTLPPRKIRAVDDFSDIDAIANAGTVLNNQLRMIRKQDPSFDVKGFLGGARSAYEMIVTAFASGDRKTLRNLLSPDVYDGFSSALDEREKAGERVSFTFVGINTLDLVSADLVNSEAQLTLRISSDIISATHDNEGKLVDGDPQAIAEIHDIWTFARNLNSKDPNWVLVGTEAEE